MALKAAGGLPRDLPTETLWDMLDMDPWYTRAHDLHEDMLEKYKETEIPGISVDKRYHFNIQEIQYPRHGQYNPLIFAQRAGTIKYVNRRQRKLQVRKDKHCVRYPT
ncbi:hypothetical protein EVAR_9473_1 [Eumeta japonica]|uniref:Uncharacterized protein n=1 Tax=Eumeta variegata TaxID=151549 RepID=A0A4C2A610_EUMVA|nr:hypothetical protein EVAR_9473_1 [Eumeta japonica]